MKINADFTQIAFCDTQAEDWIASPMPGVERKPLDRIGEEVARATSIVRYAPNSQFSPHVHTGGEEFVVLEGVFQDEHGDYPPGSYVRNPPQSKHTPGAKQGCVIFVKLWQFDLQDRQHVNVLMQSLTPEPDQQTDVTVRSLYRDENEIVSHLSFKKDTQYQVDAELGAEVLVLTGELTATMQQDASQSETIKTLAKHAWLRVPMGARLVLSSPQEQLTCWLKTHHLNQVAAQIDRLEAIV